MIGFQRMKTMTTHKVKSWVPFFQAFKRGEKKHDMRDMIDRVYKVGDDLILEEYDPFKGEYTGDTLRMKITYITSRETPCAFSSSALDRDYCILSLEKIA
jgi:hypothetical protein